MEKVLEEDSIYRKQIESGEKIAEFDFYERTYYYLKFRDALYYLLKVGDSLSLHEIQTLPGNIIFRSYMMRDNNINRIRDTIKRLDRDKYLVRKGSSPNSPLNYYSKEKNSKESLGRISPLNFPKRESSPEKLPRNGDSPLSRASSDNEVIFSINDEMYTWNTFVQNPRIQKIKDIIFLSTFLLDGLEDYAVEDIPTDIYESIVDKEMGEY